MAVVECPKCGRAADEGAIICPGCDYILDATFLGDDITDDERDRRPKQKDTPSGRNPAVPASSRPSSGLSGPSPAVPARSARVDFGEDAMILGNLDDAEVSSFKSRDAGLSQREVTQTKFYIGGAVAQLMEPDAIPEIAAGVSGASIRMTPFERHVLSFVNGRRSVGRIQKKSAMEESEFKTAIAMLADKGFVRLKGWKKPRPPSSGSSSAHPATSRLGGPQGSETGSAVGAPRPASMSGGPMRSQVSQAVVRPPEPERTVVVSMEHVEAMAKLQKPAAVSKTKRPQRSPIPDQVSIVDTPVAPMPVPASIPTDGAGEGFSDVATRIGGNPTLSAPAPIVPGRRFASLQAGVPDSAGEQSVQRDRPAPASASLVSATADIAADSLAATAHAGAASANDAGEDPLAIAAASAWDAEDNQSSVFADVSGVSQRPTTPAVDDAGDADGFDDGPAPGLDPGRTGTFDALRDPTGMGDSPDEDEGAGAGAAVEDDGDGDGVGDDGPAADDDDAPFASAEALSAQGAERSRDDDDDDDGDDDGDGDDRVTDDEVSLGPARRIHDEVTAAPAPAPPADDDGDFVTAPPTAHILRPMTLPSEALSPVVIEPAPVVRPAVPLPGQAVVPVVPVVPIVPAAAVATTPLSPAPPMALPGQAILKSGDVGFTPPPLPATAPSTTAPQKPVIATRVSSASQVPFELRKKAERIYEQAIKDIGEGRVSSAMMNAKLAMNFDPTVDAYRELHEELARQKASPKAGGPRPQELVLFEQASDAEGRGDYLKAVALLEQAIALNPRAAALYNRIGVVLSIRLKRHDEALAHLKKAIELEPGSIVYMNNFSKVTGLLESVIEKAPRKRGQQDQGDRVAVKKIRPKMF